MKELYFNLDGDWETREVYLNGKHLDPAESQKVRNHSPDGFNWGYGGSGPAQLALAVLLELFDKETASKHYQTFKFKFIAWLPQSDFDIKGKIQINDEEISISDIQNRKKQ